MDDSVMAILKRETRELHRDTERKPLMKAMLRGELDRGCFVEKLMGYLAVFDELARATEGRMCSTAMKSVYRPELDRRAHLRVDLGAVAHKPSPALKAWRERTLPERLKASRERYGDGGLLGWWYVLEGSSLGGQVLAPRLERRYGSLGQTYYVGYGARTRLQWGQFCIRMNTAIVDEAGGRASVGGAHDAFSLIGELFDCIWHAHAGPTRSLRGRRRSTAGATMAQV